MPKNCIGLDIGSSSIKVIQLKVTKRDTQLLNFGIEPVPPQSIVDGSVMNTAAVADAISSIMANLKIKAKDVAIAISGHSVIIKKITMPAMSKDELAEQITWEAEHHIPFSKDEVEIDHQIINTDNDANQMDVLLVAAKKEVVSDYSDAVREAHLNPVVVDIGAFALQNCHELNYGKPVETVALLHVGASISSINILSEGSSVFTRDVTIGGLAYTEEIQKNLNVSFEEAEAYKCGGETGDEVIPHEVEQILEQQSDIMAGEFQRSFDFYLATAAEGQIDRIYLSGGSAKVNALRKAIERRSRVPVDVMDPFREVVINENAFDMAYVRAHAPLASIALGLALRSEGDNL